MKWRNCRSTSVLAALVLSCACFTCEVYAAPDPAPTAPASADPSATAPAVTAPPTLNPTNPPAITVPGVSTGIPEPALPGTGIVVGIQFEGLKHLSDSILRDKIQTKVNAPYSEATVQQDAQAILDTGYFYSVRPRIQQSATGATIIFDVVENPYIKGINITGNHVVATKTLVDLMRTSPNQVLNTQLLRSDLHKIEDYYASKGYIYAHVLDVKADPNTGIVQIVIGEGIIEKIEIQGNKKTKAYVILHPIKTRPGQVFNINTWKEDLKAIARLNIFSDIHYDQMPGDELGKIILVLTVVEQRTGTINFGVGYNTRERGIVFVDLADTNFRGRAESVDAEVELGGYQTRASYRLSFFEPWLGQSNYSLSASIYKQQTDRIIPGTNGNSVNGRYYEQRTGETLSIGNQINETRRVFLDLKNESIGSDSVYGGTSATLGGSLTTTSSNISPFILQSGTITSIGGRFIQDTRDLPLNPRSGTYDEIVIEPGRGTFQNPGDTGTHRFDYLRISADLRRYIPVGALTRKEGIDIQKVLAFRLLAGRSSPGIPAFEYFFAGGADSLRGYQDDNFFGQNMLLGSVEFRIPVALNKLQWVLFSDAGDAWGGNYTSDTGFRVYPDVGSGLRVLIPQIGPIRLDFAYGLYGWRTQFSVGPTF